MFPLVPTCNDYVVTVFHHILAGFTPAAVAHKTFGVTLTISNQALIILYPDVKGEV